MVYMVSFYNDAAQYEGRGTRGFLHLPKRKFWVIEINRQHNFLPSGGKGLKCIKPYNVRHPFCLNFLSLTQAREILHTRYHEVEKLNTALNIKW